MVDDVLTLFRVSTGTHNRVIAVTAGQYLHALVQLVILFIVVVTNCIKSCLLGSVGILVVGHNQFIRTSIVHHIILIDCMLTDLFLVLLIDGSVLERLSNATF